jgi:hypothetical protein
MFYRRGTRQCTPLDRTRLLRKPADPRRLRDRLHGDSVALTLERG